MNTRAACARRRALRYPHVAAASGHGPVFGATTPTLGKGGWSLDTAWTLRTGRAGSQRANAQEHDQLWHHREPADFGVAACRDDERHVAGGSHDEPDVERAGTRGAGRLSVPAPRRSASAGGRKAPSTPEGPSRSNPRAVASRRRRRSMSAARPATRRARITSGSARPAALHRETRRPTRRQSLRQRRLWLPAQAAARRGTQAGCTVLCRGDRGRPTGRPCRRRSTADRRPLRFVGPTTLILYRAFAFEAGVLFPAYQRVDAGRSKERLRVAVNVSYFFWLK